MAKETLFLDREISGFTYLSEFAAYCFLYPSAPFLLEVGQTYEVHWDGEVFACASYSTEATGVYSVYIGDGTQIGGTGNGEPFVISYTPSTNYLSFFADNEETSHTVGVYQIVEEEPGENPGTSTGAVDIVLKDRSGNPVQYPGVNTIKVNTTDGGTQNFGAYDPETLTPDKLAEGVTVGGVVGTMTVPLIVENVIIEPDFSDGDFTANAPDGVAIRSAIIQKPDTLTPGNIAEGVNIAGIIGTLVASTNVKIASGTISSAQSSDYTVTHDLGVIPDIVILKSGYIGGYGHHSLVVGFSSAFATLCGIGLNVAASANTSGKIYCNNFSNSGIENTTNAVPIHAATETTFVIDASSTYKIYANSQWLAIGGLT